MSEFKAKIRKLRDANPLTLGDPEVSAEAEGVHFTCDLLEKAYDVDQTIERLQSTLKNKVQFEMTLFDDESVRKKLEVMTKMEVMFDDERNSEPDEYYELITGIPLGSKLRITLEVVE